MDIQQTEFQWAPETTEMKRAPPQTGRSHAVTISKVPHRSRPLLLWTDVWSAMALSPEPIGQPGTNAGTRRLDCNKAPLVQPVA